MRFPKCFSLLLLLFLSYNCLSQEAKKDQNSDPKMRGKQSKNKSVILSDPDTIVYVPFEFLVNKIDDFTGHRLIGTKEISLFENRSLGISGIYADSSLALMLYIRGQGVECIRDGCEALFKFSNDTILSLMYHGKTKCDESLLITYIVDEAALNLFVNNNVTKIRVKFTDGSQDFEIPVSRLISNKELKLQTAFGQILQFVLDESRKKPEINIDF